MLTMLNIQEELRALIARNGTSLRKTIAKLNTIGYIATTNANIANKINKGTITFNEVQYILDNIGYKIVIVRK